MRSYDETSEFDVKEAAELRAEPWMLRLVKANPDYCGWAPGDDYMGGGTENGWESNKSFGSWTEFGPWALDDLNVCAAFYFEVGRASRECGACGRSGLNPASRKVSDDFYAFGHEQDRWSNRITQDEVDVLLSQGRLSFAFQGRTKMTADEVNAREAGRGFCHDAINRWILIETRCKRLGIWGTCVGCGGSGHVYTSEMAGVSLILWMLHPRKGASRGVEVKGIQQEDVPSIAKWLAEASAQNAARFTGAAALLIGP